MNIIQWVHDNPFKVLLCGVFLSSLSMMLFAMYSSRKQDKAIAAVPGPHKIMDELSESCPVSWIKLYAGCFGNTMIHYQYTAGTPTLKGELPQYGCVQILKVVLQNGLQTSECLLSVMTAKQVKLLCASVYREHEHREIHNNATQLSTGLN